MSTFAELKVTVFSDLICPFCYVGYHRLLRLRDSYDLKINWCFLEIHPETSAQSEPIASLDYPSETWLQMMRNLKHIAEEEDIQLAEINFITNSKNALLLAEATKQVSKKRFYSLHESLFRAYFIDGLNIADKKILRRIAKSCRLNNATINAAWSNSAYALRLQQNYNEARKYNIESVPSFIFGDKLLTGVVAEKNLRKAAAALLEQTIPCY